VDRFKGFHQLTHRNTTQRVIERSASDEQSDDQLFVVFDGGFSLGLMKDRLYFFGAEKIKVTI
jgi:hypothetical protein